MSKIIIANWKINPLSVSEAVKLAKKEDIKGVVIASPFVFLESVGKILKHAELAAQNTFWEEKGAYTGEISAQMLKNIGVKYVIIGHSERRRLGETDKIINKKITAAIKADLTPILCVGEPLNIRKKGLTVAKKFVKNQLQLDFKNANKLIKLKAKSLIIAYEPVWAIGTGIPDNPSSAAEMHKFIKNFLKTKNYRLKAEVLYGGSVNAKNAASFLNRPEIDGALVGGASLNPKEFRMIVDSINNKIKK